MDTDPLLSTGASFLSTPDKETPVFIRFSTVAGSRGSADTVRDVHGFAVRFYTDEGNFGRSSITGLFSSTKQHLLILNRHRW